MKAKYIVLLAALVLATKGMAEVTSVDADVDAELNNMYTGQQSQSGTVSVQTIVQQPTQTTQQSALAQVQKQPTTLIEASPLSETRADSIRKSRQDEELKTEARIVEKLEQSRMEDEKKRSAVLFGDRFNQMNNQQQIQQPEMMQQPVQQVVQQPAPVQQPIIIQQQESTRDVVREEIRAALEAEESAVTAPVEVKYFGAVVGISEYPDVKNVKSNYTLGATFGSKYDSMMLEGTFLLSNYSADIRNYASNFTDSYDINQYQTAIAAKYQLFAGIVRPVVGATIAYSYRKFSQTNFGVNEDTGNSHAIDLGIIGGVDLELTQKMAIGLEYKYMFNLSSRVNANYNNSTYGYVGTPIEKLQYYIMAITGRVNF